MAKLNLRNPIVFFDLETTGLQIGEDRIVEIAAIKLLPNGSREQFETRINPEMPIPLVTSKIHGIYDEDVKDMPTFQKIGHDLKEFIGISDLGGYNSNRFDIPFLVEEFLRVGIPIDFKKRKFVDVQQIFFKKEERTLSAAYKFYCDLNLENAHSALADTEATISILESQLDRYDDLENDMKFLHSFSNGNDIVDYARRLVLKDGVPVFNFGKHKGVSVAEVFKREPQYYDWMMQANFPRDTKQCISDILNQTLLNKNT